MQQSPHSKSPVYLKQWKITVDSNILNDENLLKDKLAHEFIHQRNLFGKISDKISSAFGSPPKTPIDLSSKYNLESGHEEIGRRLFSMLSPEVQQKMGGKMPMNTPPDEEKVKEYTLSRDELPAYMHELKMSEMRREVLKTEIGRLSSMDDIKARIFGLTEEEVLDG